MKKQKRMYRLMAWLLSSSMLFQSAGITSYAAQVTDWESRTKVQQEVMVEETSEQVISDGETETFAMETETVSQDVIETQATVFEQDYLMYEVLSESDKTVKLTGVNRTDFNQEYQHGTPPFEAADITIPATVSNGTVTYKVVEIGDFAFADYIYNQEYQIPFHGDEYVGNNLYVKKITVSDGIKKIGNGAFYRMYILEKIVLPDSVEEIGMAAFSLDKQRVEYSNASGSGNTVLKVNIPKNIKIIEAYTYSGVTFEGVLRIPDGVEKIKESAFGWDKDLYGELFNYAAVDIPATVKNIGHNAFCNSSLIQAVLRKTTLPQIESSNIENIYSSMMFGYRTEGNLQVYVPANLVTGYGSSGLSSYVSGITFKDIAGYEEEDYSIEPFHFVYQGEKVTKLEVRGTDVFSVVMANEKLNVDDIHWKLKLIKSSCSLLTEAEDCAGLTYGEDGSISITIHCAETTVELIGTVTGYKEVVLQIHGLYQEQGDTFWIDKLAALTQDEIKPLATVYSQRGTKEQIEEIRTKAEEITAGCTTDREKIFAIEQWVANHVAYDYDYLAKFYEKGISPYEEPPQRAYDVFTNRYTVCGGYAILSEVMVRSIGIPCVYIEGVAGGPHAWNAAYDSQNQEWIYFDATWDTAGSLFDSQFSVTEVGDSCFDFDPVQKMTQEGRYALWMNIDEREISYDTTPYVNKHFITLYEGQTGQLDFYGEMGDATFTVEEEYVEEDVDFNPVPEKLEREGRFITVDSAGKITALKEGQSVISAKVNMGNDGYITWVIYVRVMPREEIYFGEEMYTLAMGEKGNLDVFRGKGVWKNSTWGKKAITELVKLTSDNTGVVKVDEKGNLTPVFEGEATITGKMYFDDSMENLISCKVVVTNQSTEVEEKEEFTLDNLKYEILTKPAGEYPGTVSVIKQNYRNYESSAEITVEIPETVEYDGGTYKVTVIGKNAFSDLVGKANISIPASVERIEERAFSSDDQGADVTGNLIFPQNSQLTYIGPFAFAYNEKLSKVDLSNCTKLEKIDIWAFAECSYFSMDWQGNETSTGIAEVILPDNLKVIEQHAFYMCQQLSKINIPKNMDYIGHYAFASTKIGGVLDFSGVKEIGEDILTESDGWVEGIILNDNWTEIGAGLLRGVYTYWIASASCLEAIGGADQMQSGDVLISENITSIADKAFYANYNIRNVQAPGVETIGEEAFYGCISLERVQAPKVTVIGEKAFGQCTNLTDIDFEQNLTVIPEKAFIKCSKLIDFTLGEELTEIEYGSLYECGASNSIRIPSERLTYFGQRCFKNGMNFYIPKAVSNEYMKELKDYSIDFYDLEGNLLESNIKGIDALLMEYPQYEVGDSYEVIRNAIGVYLEYSDGNIEKIEDYSIEAGFFVKGGQEIEISYLGFTDTIKVGSSPNKQPIWYISPTDPSYTSKIYKTGTSFQQLRDLFVIRAYYEDGTYEVFEEYDIWPGTFQEGENWVTFGFCDFVGGAYKIQSRCFEASSDVEEEPDDPNEPDNPDNPDDPNEPDNPDDPNEPDNPDAMEGKITGIEVYISSGSELLYTPKAGYRAEQEDFAVYYTVKTETGNRLIEATEFEIDGGELKKGKNEITIIAYTPDGTRFEEKVEVDAEAKLEVLDIKLKTSVKLKAGDTIKPSQFIGTATYSGVNGYTELKEVKNFTIEGNAVIAEGRNTFCFAYTESTFAYGTIIKTAEWSMYSDDKPVLSVSAVTINPYAKEETDFTIYMPFGLTAWTNGGFYLNTKGDVLRGISYVSDENGVCTIQLSGDLKDKTYKLYVKVTVAETEKEYYLPIKVTLKSVLPKITATAEKMNIFFTDEDNRTSDITLKNISDQVIQRVEFEENSAMDQYFDVIFDNSKQTLALKLTNPNIDTRKIASKGKLLIWLEHYNQPVKVSVNIGITEKAPKIKITPSSININTKMYDEKETCFEVTMQDGKAYVPVTLSGTIPQMNSGGEGIEQITAQENEVFLKLKNTAEFHKVKTVKINLQASNWKKPVAVSYKIKTINVLPKATLDSKSLTLDMRAIEGEESTILRFDTTPGEIGYKELPEILTAVKKNETAPTVTLEKVDEKTYIVKAAYTSTMTKGTYKYDITPELTDGTKLKKVTLSVKVTTANKAASATLKAQRGGKIELINREDTKFVYQVTPTVKGTYIKEIRLKKVELGKDTVDLSLFDVKIDEAGEAVDRVKVSASENGNLLAGKKYKLTFEVIPATSAAVVTELTPADTVVTITPKESKLQLNANVKSATLYRNIPNMNVTYKLTPKMAGAKITVMEYVPNNKVPQGAFEIIKVADGGYSIRIADKTKVTAKKSYKLSFKVRAKGGTKDVVQSITIKVQ